MLNIEIYADYRDIVNAKIEGTNEPVAMLEYGDGTRYHFEIEHGKLFCYEVIEGRASESFKTFGLLEQILQEDIFGIEKESKARLIYFLLRFIGEER